MCFQGFLTANSNSWEWPSHSHVGIKRPKFPASCLLQILHTVGVLESVRGTSEESLQLLTHTGIILIFQSFGKSGLGLLLIQETNFENTNSLLQTWLFTEY